MDVIYTPRRDLTPRSRHTATSNILISSIYDEETNHSFPWLMEGQRELMDLRDHIRDVPDFPEPGIVFKDITPLLADAKAFDYAVASLVDHYSGLAFDAIAVVESRGFLFGAPLAHELEKSIVLVRKPGKLPAETYTIDYDLEYGTNTLEIHIDGVEKGQKILIIDDLLATGGTLAAAAQLVETAGGIVSGIGVIIELSFLGGRNNLSRYEINSLIQY